MTGTPSETRRAGRARWRGLGAGLALAACCVGCARPRCCAGGGQIVGNQYASLAESARGEIAPDLSSARPYAELTPSGVADGLLLPAGRYQSLDPESCRARGAAGSVLARLLESERGTIRTRSCATARADSLRRELLSLRAEDERNRAAGAAMETFYRLAEAEAANEAVGRGLARLDRALADIAALREQGLPVGIDATALDRQRIELCQQGEQAARSLSELNMQLARLIEAPSDPPIWPAVDWRPVEEAIDVEAAVAEGLAMRADLEILRRLDASLDEETLPAARGSLVEVDPMLGQANLPGGALSTILCRHDGGAELDSRRAQIATLLADRQRGAEGEIRQAVLVVHSQFREIALANEFLASWRGRASDLRQRRGAGGATAFEVSAADLEIARAELTLASKIVAWRIAQARLRQSQGLLGR